MQRYAVELGEVLLEGGHVVGDGRLGLALLRQLVGDLEPEVDVLGAQLDDLDQLGPRPGRLPRGRVVIGQGLVDLDGVGGLLRAPRWPGR